MSLLKLMNPLPERATPHRRAYVNPTTTNRDFYTFLSGLTDDFLAIQGRRRLINLPPRHLDTVRQALRIVIRDAKELDVFRLTKSAEELDTALEHIQMDAHGYTQRFDLRRLFDGFLDEARRTLAEIESGETGNGRTKSDDRPLVLVVDDEPHVHRLIERAIARDVEVLNVVNCLGALATLKTHRPDLIILDESLPDMRGTDFLKTIKSQKELANIPVIMLSNSNDDDTVVAGLCNGALDFLSKDMKTLALRPRIMEILEHGRTRLTGHRTA
ncbi:response regulator [Algicella marina]|uniref:Response regulator n=1 Tax=Algicella marina TaxID=2683284 RepID=A0A6P1T2V9_9RHOB|nr:response regulator [Algicella marina]QHQ35639.1 response regulator [Algicella marina]